MKLVVLSPHPDDAVLSCWGVLTGGDEVKVLTVFAAQPPRGSALGAWDGLTGAHDAVSRWRERMDEDRRALELAGCEPVTLEFLDGDYRRHEPDQAELERLFASEEAAVIYAPAGLLGHRDHVAVRDAALRLRGTGPEVRLYADQPHANVFGWPGWVTGARDHRFLKVEELWASMLSAGGIDLGRLRPTVQRLDGEWPAKQAALAAYRTQAAVLSRLAPVEDLRYEVEWSWR